MYLIPVQQWSRVQPSLAGQQSTRAGGTTVAGQRGAVNVSLSRVTWPVWASALPRTVTLSATSMSVSAKMVPTNVELVPSVAELPTCQNTLHSLTPLISETLLAAAVINVEVLLKMKTASGLF